MINISSSDKHNEHVTVKYLSSNDTLSSSD
jgi:hypothetical protein